MDETSDSKFTPADLSEKDQQMIDTNQSDSVDEESNPEFELTPEIESLIMDKVQDIFLFNTAMTRVGRLDLIGDTKFAGQELANTLKNIFRFGILGSATKMTKNGRVDIYNMDDPDVNKKWATEARQNRSPRVHFNIIGKSLAPKTNTNNPYYNEITPSLGRVSLIFDIEGIKDITSETVEKTPDLSRDYGMPEDDFLSAITHQPSLLKQRGKTYRLNDEVGLDLMRNHKYTKDDVYKLGRFDEYGFVLAHRVQPKRFKGLVVNYERNFQHSAESLTDEKILKLHQIANTKIFSSMVLSSCQANPGLAIPVYDSNGNLLWPKQMTYEEVVKFVEERDKEKSPKDKPAE